MSTVKIKYQNLSETNRSEGLSTAFVSHIKNEETDTVDTSEEDFKILILNNLLMSVQFFENYESDIESLRETWYKEYVLQQHRKKCFYADSIFREMRTQVKFRPKHGANKGKDFLLHPLRIFVLNDNVQAAYDPGVFGRVEPDVMPFYQLTVKPCDDNKKEKSGYVSLVEFNKQEPPKRKDLTKSLSAESPASRKSLYLPGENEMYEKNSGVNPKRKSVFDLKSSRKLTKTEKLIGLQSKNLNPMKLERKASVKFDLGFREETIPNNGFYSYEIPDTRLRSKSIHDVRMNNFFQTSSRIPRNCFQTVEVKRNVNSRRTNIIIAPGKEGCFMTKNFLNAAAFKGHFCDLLIEKLGEPLSLSPKCINDSFVKEEYVVVNQDGVQNQITPAVRIIDWNDHVVINSSVKDRKIRELEWPTSQMKAIMYILPCYLVPKGYFQQSKENADYEKEWKLVFPKAEEFLLLHMMHSHLRCYFFVLAIYKTFIESETNPASFGPRHLLHHFFWMVYKNFLSWPEDRPGETLLRFFQALYKKLKNKSLYDFFITTRNLFRESLLKDLHKVQAITKKILENPLPYVFRAVRNLHLEPGFYPALDVTTLNSLLKKPNPQKSKPKNQKENAAGEKATKNVHWEDDAERMWKKNVIKQINLEKKIEEQEELDKLSIDSVDIEETPKLDCAASQYNQILILFISHFLEMGIKSTEFKALNQALIYLSQTQKLLQLLPVDKTTKEFLQQTNEKIVKLKKQCDELKRNPPPKKEKPPAFEKDVKKDVAKAEEKKENVPVIKIIEKKETEVTKIDDSDSDEDLSTKL